MSFGRPSWIAAQLVGEDVAAERVHDVRSQIVTYGTTAGPFPGIGGASLSAFQMTLVVCHDLVMVFADQRLLGWAPYPDGDAVEVAWLDLNANKDRLVGMLRRPGTCPILTAAI